MTSDLPDPVELGAVVVGVDASEQARTAALWAAAEAAHRGQPLNIVHAADIEGRSVLTRPRPSGPCGRRGTSCWTGPRRPSGPPTPT